MWCLKGISLGPWSRMVVFMNLILIAFHNPNLNRERILHPIAFDPYWYSNSLLPSIHAYVRNDLHILYLLKGVCHLLDSFQYTHYLEFCIDKADIPCDQLYYKCWQLKQLFHTNTCNYFYRKVFCLNQSHLCRKWTLNSIHIFLHILPTWKHTRCRLQIHYIPFFQRLVPIPYFPDSTFHTELPTEIYHFSCNTNCLPIFLSPHNIQKYILCLVEGSRQDKDTNSY